LEGEESIIDCKEISSAGGEGAGRGLLVGEEDNGVEEDEEVEEEGEGEGTRSMDEDGARVIPGVMGELSVESGFVCVCAYG